MFLCKSMGIHGQSEASEGTQVTLICWIASFLQERTTIIKVHEGNRDGDRGPTGLPNLPVLFLFFIADLLDTTNDIALRTSTIGFVDNIHVLTYRESTERNCRTP